MYSDLVLVRKLNHRNIELHHTTRGETVGVLRRDGDYQYLPWLGFISAADARKLAGAQPVKLSVARIGRAAEFSTRWEDIGEGRHVQGCLVESDRLVGAGARSRGVYAVVEGEVRVV